MAQQKGILPVKGTIGNLTFYKSKDGFLVREKGGVDAKRIATDPAFQRTRENGAEFGKAGKAGKLLRNALRSLSQNASDSKMVGRLTKQMMEVIKADLVNSRGSRNVIEGEVELLQDFEFNIHGKLSTSLYAPYTTAIDRVTGVLSVQIPSFIPANMVAAPAGATHFKINAGGAEIDFEGNRFVVETQSTAELPWDNVLTNAITLSASVTANSSQPLFLVLGIEFCQEVNGSMYSLKNGAFNSLSLVKVSGQ
ncbi:MAG: hypothetical protein ACTHK0_18165 [Ginsengibacter sp.]